MEYLDTFLKTVQSKWKGSLIRVRDVESVEPNAKKYLGQLAHQKKIEKLLWGWYWIPETYRDFFDFLATDKNFKVLHNQSAAAFWNGDFVHRDQFTVAVADKSFARALAVFAKKRGWNLAVHVRTFKPSEYRKVEGLLVEALEETIIDCVKTWAFADAFAAMQQNRKQLRWSKIEDRRWERVPGSSARIGQVIQYGARIIGTIVAQGSRTVITDDFLRRQVEEAAERVGEFA